MWRYTITRSYSIVLSKTKSWRKKIEEEKYTESIVEISNDRVTFARLFYYTFLFLPPPILKSFRAMSSRLKNGIPVDKKIFSTRYQRRGILDVGWQRSHGALNIFSVCLSRAKISRSSRRDLLQKKKKKIRALLSPSRPCFFLPHSSFFPPPLPVHPPRFPFAASRRILTGILASVQHPLQLSRYFTQRRRPPRDYARNVEQIDQNRARKTINPFVGRRQFAESRNKRGGRKGGREKNWETNNK